MSLDVLLEVLGTFEGFATELAFVRLEWNVDTDVGSDVVAFYCVGAAGTPVTLEIEIVRALAANMALTNMFLKRMN